MSIYGTLKELSNHYVKKQNVVVDTVTEKAPILDIIPFAPASHSLWNVYENTMDITGPAFVPLNSPLPAVDMTTDIKKVDLDIMGGVLEVPEDQAKLFGGAQAYFTKKMPKILSKAGMSTEQRMLYGNFIPYAVSNGMARTAGGTGNTTASIVAVRFEREVTNGLYSPEGWKNNSMLDELAINGGNLYSLTTAGHKYQGVLGYGMRLKGYFGMQIADKRTCAAILNITPNNLPTSMQIDDLLADIRADKRDTWLFMHVKVRNLLGSYKEKALKLTVTDKEYNTSLESWDGIRIVTSYNFLGFGETATAGLPA